MDVWRCDITGNPVGTDTRMVGCACKCQGCKAGDEIERLRAALQWIADQEDNEDGDLDDIILCANKALAHEQREAPDGT